MYAVNENMEGKGDASEQRWECDTVASFPVSDPSTASLGSVDNEALPAVDDAAHWECNDGDSMSSATASECELTDDEDCDDFARMAEAVQARRWSCDLCVEVRGSEEPAFQLRSEACSHTFCRDCLRGCIRSGFKCPFDDTPIPAIDACGVMNMNEFLFQQKSQKAEEIGGIMCSNEECPGVVASCEGCQSRPTECPACQAKHCGRRSCGVPWTVGHRCWDICQEEVNALIQADSQTRVCGGGSSGEATKACLSVGPRIRPCPRCAGMVERRPGDSNIVCHEACGTRFCYICRRFGASICPEFDCLSTRECTADTLMARADIVSMPSRCADFVDGLVAAPGM